VALSGGLSRQDPDSCRASETASEEITQIESGGASGEPGVVLDGALIAQFQAPGTTAGDLGR
jgi:hypothetical protein